jgi:hypothetical protein
VNIVGTVCTFQYFPQSNFEIFKLFSFLLFYVLLYFLPGKSTHNQRIERLWRDVFSGCLSLFYGLFLTMEEEGILDRENDTHIWCLHYVFLPISNEHIRNWRDAWILHPIRTERNKTPFQLWVIGLEHARTVEANRIIETLQVCIDRWVVLMQPLFRGTVYLFITFFSSSFFKLIFL